jgi:hypothetical protein
LSKRTIPLTLLLTVASLAGSARADDPAGDPGPPRAIPGAAAPSDATQPLTASEAFTTRVKTIEEQVVDLKEKIFRTKSRLLLLQETVLGGDLSLGARAVLVHRNEMSSAFRLESVAYSLDGAPLFTKVDNEGDLSGQKEIPIFDGRIVPGQHQISVRLTYRGHGYGVFSYLEGYKFTVQSSFTMNAEAGKVTTVKIVGHEKGGFTADLKDRPAVRYDIEVSKETTNQHRQASAVEP